MYTETQTFLTFILRSSLDLETRLGDGVEVAETLLTSSTSGDPIGVEDDPSPFLAKDFGKAEKL